MFRPMWTGTILFLVLLTAGTADITSKDLVGHLAI